MGLRQGITLAAIVRDEMMNPAGGIQRFLASTVPHVDEAVIVDTGSVDGTRDILADATREYANLRVYDRVFKGFDDARNHSFTQVRTSHTLILDADEYMSSKDLTALELHMLDKPTVPCWYLKRKNEMTSANQGVSYSTIAVRFFLTEKFHARRIAFEDVWPKGNSGVRILKNEDFLLGHTYHIEGAEDAEATIVHFFPPNGREGKHEWYKSLCRRVGLKRYLPAILRPRLASTSEHPKAARWKEFNPVRDTYC